MSGPIRLRRLPLEADGYPYDGTNAADIVAWAPPRSVEIDDDGLVIHTDRGPVLAQPGDTIMIGLVGEAYPLKPEARTAGWEILGERP